MQVLAHYDMTEVLAAVGQVELYIYQWSVESAIL